MDPTGKRTLLRGFVVWLVIAVTEVLHGALRTLFVAPVVGDLASRQIGVFTGSLLILSIAYLSIRWIGARQCRDLVAVGLLWLALMLAFEIALGRALGASWERILADYLPWRGGFMLAGMAVLALAPMLTAAMRARRACR